MNGQRRLGRRTLATMAAATVPFGAMAFGEAGASGLAAAPASALAPQAQPGATTVDVYGNGSVRAVPDQASATIGVEVERAALGEAQAEASTLAAAVIAAIKAAGVADEDIRTANFSVRVVRERERDKENGKEDDQRPVQPTFRVANAVEVTVRDVDSLGSILDDAIAAGANDVQGIMFTLADPAAATRQARALAMDDARTKAEELAAAAGMTVSRVVSIAENYAPPPAPRDVATAIADASGPIVPIAIGADMVAVEVQVIYELV
jgi:uncharacterized protein YggE